MKSTVPSGLISAVCTHYQNRWDTVYLPKAEVQGGRLQSLVPNDLRSESSRGKVVSDCVSVTLFTNHEMVTWWHLGIDMS